MLSIQKQILLLSEFHFNEFANYLKTSKAELPFKLIHEIRNFGWEQPESEVLSKRIYGQSGASVKGKFLQLVHHTFKLSGFLSRNYPAYLKHNLNLIEEYTNKGDRKKANLLAEYLLDIAEKIEDFTTQINVLKFQGQQAFITEFKSPVKFHEKIEKLIHAELRLNTLYKYIRENLHFKNKDNVSVKTSKADLKFFDEYLDDECFCIKTIAKFGKYYQLSFQNDPQFYEKSTLKELENLERELQNNAFIVFHFLDDLLFKIIGLKLQLMVSTMDTEGMMKESSRLIEESSSLKFWQSYINVPEIFAIAIQASHYVTNYSATYKADHYKELPEAIKQNINKLKQVLATEIEKPIWNEGYIIKLINTRSIYSGLLMLGTPDEVKKGIDLMEETLTSYQQIPFQKFLDGMFASLIIGYFSLQQYAKISECYKRYKKSTSGNKVNLENDITISAYYYASQWLLNGRKQYSEKLFALIPLCEENPNLTGVKTLILDLAQYFNIKS